MVIFSEQILGDNSPLLQNVECMRKFSYSDFYVIYAFLMHMENLLSRVRCIQFILLRVCNTAYFHPPVYVAMPSLLPRSTVGVTKQNDSLDRRRDAVILNRLQIGHTRATHAHLLGV